jgi:hypothetical protein
MHYNIIILDTSINIYMDIVVMFTHWCKVNNISYLIINYNSSITNDESNKCIFFGTEYYKYRIPKGSIITEFDCIDVVKNRLNLSLTKNNKILSYSSLLTNYLNKVYPKTKVGHFYYGYSSDLDYGYNNNNKDIDICFIGSLYPERRQKIFNDIRNRFKDRNIFIGGYNPYLALEDRGKVYKNSKIILSIYSEEKMYNYTYGSRIFPAVSTGGFVIAERCIDPEQHSVLERICINTEPDKLLDTIEYYLTNESEREKLRKTFYTNVKNIVAKIDL